MQNALRLRRALGWSQPEMGRYLGVRQATVSRIENGHATSDSVIRLLGMLERDFAEGRVQPKIKIPQPPVSSEDATRSLGKNGSDPRGGRGGASHGHATGSEQESGRRRQTRNEPGSREAPSGGGGLENLPRDGTRAA